MDRVIDSGIEMANGIGRVFCSHAWSVFLQVSVLIAVLLVVDLLLRRRVRAVVRYAMWMLVFVKLLLPPALSLPTGIGYYRSETRVTSQKQTEPAAERSAPIVEVRPIPREPVAASPPALDVSRANTVPSPALPAIVRPAITWQVVVFLGWLAGVLTLSVYLLRRVQYVRKLIHKSAPASEAIADMLTQCAARLRLRSCPALRLSDDAPGPAVCGLFRPVVLMPASMAENLSGERLRTVLVHELAHIKRADLWVNFAQTLLLVAYFYHPLLWLANAVVRRLREQAVDETVLVALDAEAESYGTTLIDLAEMTVHRPALGLRLIGIAESKKALEGRIRHMITRPKPRTAKLGLAGALAIALTAAVLLPMARGERARDAWDARTVALTQGQVDPSHRDHQVSAAALLDSDHELIQQVLALVNQVEKNYPQQATHWPSGPMLYHVNAEGQITIWLYQELWRRDKDCADDEVGWGSSRSVNATGMYYLPDGTPLRSRWYERGGGMKDIRVKIGRRVADGERVGLILKRHLSPEADLWSRDGRERTILLDAWDDLPVAIMVRVDKPASMGGWRVGNVKANPQTSDQFGQLVITGPPLENRGPMLVTVRLPQATPPAATEPSAEAVEEAKPDEGVVADSHEQLSALGRTLLIYANDHDDRLPETLAEVQDDIDQAGDLSLSWVQENVAYLGRGMTTSNEPDEPVAYDKTLYERGGGTNVLRLDTSVAFESPERLEELGIAPDKPSPGALRISARRLRFLGITLVAYAKDHDDSFPDTLDVLHSDTASYYDEELKRIYGNRYTAVAGRASAQMDARMLPWYREHVQYLGKGVKANDDPAGVLAYDKTLLAEGKGTNVLRVDARVEFVSPERCKELMPSAASAASPEARAESAMRLKDLGKAVLFYAVKHDGKLSDELIDVRAEFGVGFSWLYDHVEYLGRGMTTQDNPERPIAYDRTLFLEGNGTNVLYLNSRVVFETPERLKTQGIIPDIEARTQAVERLKALSEQLCSYGAGHEGKLPYSLSQLKGYTDDAALAWLLANVMYIGRARSLSDPDRILIAYDQTLLQKGQGTVVLYLGGNVVFENARRLEQLGIRPGRCDYDVERVIADENLTRLAMRAVSYALDFGDGVLPKTLAELKATRTNPDESFWAWVCENAVYVAGGTDVKDAGRHNTMPIAYTPLTSGQPGRFAVVFADCHVEMANEARLNQMGIEIRPRRDR